MEITSGFAGTRERGFWKSHVIDHHSAHSDLTSSSPSCHNLPLARYDPKWIALMYKPMNLTHPLCESRDPPSPSYLRALEFRPLAGLLSTAATAGLSRPCPDIKSFPTAPRLRLPLIGYPQRLSAADGLAELRCNGGQRRGLRRRRRGRR